jgi:competence protein ComEC
MEIPDDKFHIYFLDVTQGDSILIKTPQNHQILVDGGPKDYVLTQLSKVMPFFDKSIDFVILTHPDADHMDGILKVLERYEVKNILLTGVYLEDETYNKMLSLILEKDVKLFIAESKKDFIFGGVLVDVVYPLNQIIGNNDKDKNDTSIAVKIVYGDKNILLTGDLSIDAEAKLVSAYPGFEYLKSDILKAGHHGSKTSSSLNFLEVVNPETVVIQVGRKNFFGHPNKETLDNFSAAGVKKIYRTDMDGMVEFIF